MIKKDSVSSSQNIGNIEGIFGQKINLTIDKKN
jgi:hypothetical protein